jgi:multidrug transporter EmrE-like cation transporter
MTVPWPFLFFAGLAEVGWAVFFKQAHGLPSPA